MGQAVRRVLPFGRPFPSHVELGRLQAAQTAEELLEFFNRSVPTQCSKQEIIMGMEHLVQLVPQAPATSNSSSFEHRLAKLRASPGWATLSTGMDHHAGELLPTELVRAVGIMARLRADQVEHLALSAAVARRAAELSPRDLAGVCWAFATLAERDPKLCKDLAVAATHQSKKFNTTDLRNVAWAFAEMSVQDPGLFAAICQAARPGPDGKERFSPEDATMVAWAFAIAGEHCNALVAVLPSAEVSRQVAGDLYDHLRDLVSRVKQGYVQGCVFAETVPVISLTGFISDEEAAALAAAAKGGDLRDSMVMGSASGGGRQRGSGLKPAERNSMQSRPDASAHPALRVVRHRVARLVGVSPRQLEPSNMLSYRRGGFYGLHVDWFEEGEGLLMLGGQRVATALIYLTGLPEGGGGETAFPNLGFRVRPTARACLIYPNIDLEGRPTEAVRHEGEPVTCDKEKLVVSTFIHAWPVDELR